MRLSVTESDGRVSIVLLMQKSLAVFRLAALVLVFPLVAHRLARGAF